MSRLIRHFVETAAFSRPKVAAYPWDEWAYTDYFYFATPDALELPGRLTGLANRALCIAIAEWIALRLRTAPHAEDAQAYLDAAWVTMIRRDACEYVELDRQVWSGPLDGALRAAMLIVNDTLFEAETDFFFAGRSCWAMNLARHICDQTDGPPFEAWLDLCLQRLLAHHGGPVASARSIFDLHFNFGAPVGPALFILNLPYEPARDRVELESLLAEQAGRNPFLRISGP
jgi:hypothetical protein